VDIVLALPEVLQDVEFVCDFHSATKRVDANVLRVLDQTQQETTQLVTDSASVSDVESRLIMARFFRELGFGLRGLHQESLKVIQMLRHAGPEDLERAIFPFLGQLDANAVRLGINAEGLVTATFGVKEDWNQIAQIAVNASNCDSKLEIIGKVIENAFTRVLPNVERTPQAYPNITTFAGLFLNTVHLELGGPQEETHDMVSRDGPVIAERVQRQSRSHGDHVMVDITTFIGYDYFGAKCEMLLITLSTRVHVSGRSNRVLAKGDQLDDLQQVTVELFRQFDQDGNGHLDFEEFVATMRKMM